MSKNWTPDQWNAIAARGGSLLVSAAAGSGKTAVLVERVIRRILDDRPPVDIDRLLVVTFSKASAAEMRSRVGRRIRERLQENPDDRHLLRQQMLLENARISTIHSFCFDLIRQNFAQLGLNYDVRIGDDQELKLLRRRALQQVLARRYAQKDESGFLELVELVSGSRNDLEMEKLVERLYDFLRSHPFYEDWLEEKKGYYDPSVPVEESEWGKIILGYAREGLGYAVELLQAAVSAMDEQMFGAYGGIYHEDINKVNGLLQVVETGEWDKIIEALRDFSFGRLPALKNYLDESRKGYVNDCRNEVKKLVEELKTKRFCASAAQHADDIAFFAPRIHALFDTVMELDREYEKAKRERSVLDYSDLEHMALRLLVKREGEDISKTELALRLSGQLDEILVDEYQDTNSVQEMLFITLSRNQENLFFVGDVKQSIYRFRQAMPELFIRRKNNSFDYDGKRFPACICLDRNFRSRPAVTDAVNYFFRMLMSERVGEIRYDQSEELVCGATFPEDEQNRCVAELHIIKTDKEKKASRQTEAEYVAAYIRDLLESRMLVGGEEDRHPIRPEDICILLRSHKNRAVDYVDALAEHRIPGWASVEERFLESEEISSVLAMLQAVDNPLLDLPLTQALMSPIFAMSADDVAQIRACDKQGSMYHALQLSAQKGNEAGRRFLDVLEDLRRHAAWEGADRVILRLYDKTNFLRIARVMPLGRLRRDNLRLLVNYAAQYEERGFRGVSGFLGFVNRLRQQEGDLAPASAAANGAVTIRSIHSSKGLEYPVVILADMDKRLNRQDVRQSTQIHSRLGFACNRRDNDRMIQFATVPLEAVRIEAEREQLSEELRILYVALTRAKEKLVMMAAMENPERTLRGCSAVIADNAVLPWAVRRAQSSFEWIASAMLWHPDGISLRRCAGLYSDHSVGKTGLFRVVFSDEQQCAVQAKRKDVFRFEPADPLLVKRFEANAAYRYPYLEESLSPSKFSVSQLSHRQSGESFCTTRPAFMNEQGMTAAQKEVGS